MIRARTNPGHKAQSDRADARAAELAPILAKLQASGIMSSRALAAALTARNIPTRSGRGNCASRGSMRMPRPRTRLDFTCDMGCGSAGNRRNVQPATEVEALQAMVLTTDEARRIAANIARLPALLGKAD